MVGIDALSQQTAAVKQLSDHHELPVCAIHAPCLLFTQRVWGTDPWGKLERSAEMAHAVGADVVVVHPPFRWQKDYAARVRRRHRRAGGVDRPRLRRREHVSLAGLGPTRRRDVPPRAGTPRSENYANTTIDLSHAAIAQSDAGRDGRSGSASGCATST